MMFHRPQDIVSPTLRLDRQTQFVFVHLAVGVVLVVLNDHLNADSHADSFRITPREAFRGIGRDQEEFLQTLP